MWDLTTATVLPRENWRHSVRKPGLAWVSDAEENAPHEANFLKLNSSKVKRVLGYQPTWHIDQAVEKSAAWYKAFYQGKDLEAEMDREIEEFFLQ